MRCSDCRCLEARELRRRRSEANCDAAGRGGGRATNDSD